MADPIALVFSREDEARPFLQRYRDGALASLTEGEMRMDEHLAVVITGEGKIKATLHSVRLLARVRPGLLIHVGGCTSLRNSLESGSIVAASQAVEGDRDEIPGLSYPRMPLDVPFTGIKTAMLVTQDRALVQGEWKGWNRIAEISDSTGYAVAYVAATHGIPCSILKLVSSVAGAEQTETDPAVTSVGYGRLAEYLLRYVA